MADEDILQTIRTLVEEEHSLHRGEAADHKRLDQIEETLDQCWDLLRQRRARREFGDDTAAAKARDVETVEHYKQ